MSKKKIRALEQRVDELARENQARIDAANRKALYERLLYSLEGLPDPWEPRIGGTQKNEYIPLKVVA